MCRSFSKVLIGSVLALFFLMPTQVEGQSAFRFKNHQKRDNIHFQLLNNLVVIPVKVNGKELSFILDTGARHTLLFSLSEIDSVEVNNVTPIKIRGLGAGGTIDALKSVKNTLEVGNAMDRNHTLYVIFDETINFSPKMGVPIHGVLGYDFFKDFIVETKYSQERLIFYDPKQYNPKECKKCLTFDLQMNDFKPYIKPTIYHDGSVNEVNLLLDSGSSDALWLFNEDWAIHEIPKNYFDDFLGFGISGGIFGKRSKLDGLSLGSFEFNDVNVSFPEPEAIREINLDGNRDGSLGAEILKRFTVILDYPSRKISLEKNHFYKEPFHYNMAGIEVQHDGAVTVHSFVDPQGINLEPNRNSATDAIEIRVNPILNFFLTPRYVVAQVREGSPAASVGIEKGDEVVSINGKPSYKYKLYEISELFMSKENRRISMELNRDGSIYRVKFVLKKVL
ncbi:MAG TPA: aspartyl protease family protein [Flavobacteriaceae bacterium]|nr:aspartyl protease family protein [Flavobacteriaceae bacterium]MCB9213602.1 aspartyl protease family protein [Alteromonas sp.]HPF12103.1 aspartyl protease family protein [Flavobacteriaceae bacterium]HQU21466.1 aspartyl protease family protein [Flavobacteriaceae bacterium]HQU65616.1 aspartyl protease family protein [Flavobacteriaceae bacterium]